LAPGRRWAYPCGGHAPLLAAFSRGGFALTLFGGGNSFAEIVAMG